MLIHNPSLADEIYALNAIYGEGSMSATFSDANHTTVSVKLPGFNYSFLLRVFDDYPQSSPQVLGVDSLAESRKQEVQQNAVYLGACVPAVHYPGTVCLYDAIEEFNTVHKALQAHIQQPGDTEEDSQRKSAQRAAILRRLAVRAKVKAGTGRQESVTADPSFDVVDCAVCMDPFFRVDLNMFKTRQELKCCGQSVPLKTLREVGGLDAELLDALGLWLQELHTANPIYCPWEDCLAYIPGASGMGDYAKCHVCKKRMCMASRGKEHGGICKRDKKLQALVRKEKWKFCPWCGHLVEKRAGCNHMTCICATEFCYRCGKVWAGGQPDCDCGLFQRLD
ncbi:uncharacterized protein Z520_00852 [Fonsecaea multimorphosa CBS 102226]|uniref:IBR domain-containing protein n=1 Tax=Fonsecaea multimorphosa CBS 102226 TaxID=1442371 RepID=A0A0D2KKY9_9EURO|nr:uncharacterized protein Z520_00852 [Fonsecaea multimorphosa CBS 102226]KIY04160.1 hypothetical protein Z520_00852 [Fonsecaea multimorphosa CBS 102226]